MESVIIPTERFILRSLTAADATQRYANWFDDPDLASHINAARSPHEVSDLRHYIIDKLRNPSVLFLGIFLRGDNLHIGNLKFEPVDIRERHAVSGIMIGDRHWRGKGVAKETLEASAIWLNTVLGIEELALGVTHDNIAAQRAYLKAGFKFERLSYLEFDDGYARAMVLRVGTKAGDRQ